MSGRADWSSHRLLVVLAVGYQWFYNGANFVAFKRMRLRSVSTSELAGAAGLGVVMLVGSQSLGIVGTHLWPAGVVPGQSPSLND